MLKSLLVLGLFSIAALPVVAQDADFHRFEVGGGYSYVRVNVKATDSSVTPSVSASDSFNLQGGGGNFVINLSPSVGIVTDLNGYKITGLPSGFHANLLTYMFGPRFTYHGNERVQPFVHALFGGAHASGSGTLSGAGFEFSGDDNAFAMALGGGADYKMSTHVALRFIQVDYLMTRFKTNINSAGNASTGTQNNFRIGAGIQFRF